MVTCVIIDKYGKITDEKLKDSSLETIAKKCKFRKYENFEVRHTWKLKINKKSVYVSVFSKNNGRANNENKYDLPPPLDNELYFGSIAIVCYSDKSLKNLIDFNSSIWRSVYEKLMGGFEDIGKEEEEEEEEEVDPSQLTKHGYKKDNFIVDESEEYESDKSYESSEEESGEEESGEEETTTGEEEIEYEDTNNEITSEEEIEELEEEEEESVEEYDSVPELSEEEYLSE